MPAGSRRARWPRPSRSAASEGEGGRRLGQILVDEGYITEKVLEAFVQEQIQDTIFDLMRWDEGEFDFEVLPEVVDEDIGLSVSIENIVMEGSRRLEEWTRIKKKIPSMDIVFKMATAPGEGTFEISLKPIEWNLLLLVDGTRSVAELATETNRTDFEVARIMYGLFSAGLLEVSTDEEVEKRRLERAQQDKVLAEVRAKQAEADAKAAKEAMAREIALASEAKQRGDDQTAVEQAEEELAVELPGVEAAELRTEPEEVPEFLSGGGAQPTTQDAAVFEEMMDAVLEAPVAPVAEVQVPEPEVEVAPEPEVASEPETEVAPEPEPEVTPWPELAPELETQPETALEPELPEPESELAFGVEPGLAAAPEPEPETPIGPAEEAVTPPAEAPAADLETDLMALGLGELPADLLEPIATDEVIDATPEEPADAVANAVADLAELLVPEIAEEPETGALEPEAVDVSAFEPKDTTAQPAEAEPVVPEPEFVEFGMEDGAAIVELEAESKEAPGAIDSETLEPEEAVEPYAELAAEMEALAADVAAEVAEDEIPEVDFEPDASPDLSDILESLEEDAGPPAELIQTETFEDESGPAEGVISTDAYLADIGGDDLGVGLSTGLGDELSALTGGGGGGGGTHRPAASVNQLPEEGDKLEIRRDQTVDKELVKKIIEGIENL